MTAIDFAAFVDQLATVSGETIMPFFRTTLAVENKKPGFGFDPVTAADRAAEDAMRTLIRRSFPGHGILGEEYPSERADAEYVWILDPIDGTKSFIAGMPAWGTLIGLMRFGEPVFGMMHQPFTRERFTGDGGGARYRSPDRQPRPARAILRQSCRRLVVHHLAALDEREGPRDLCRRGKQSKALALRRRLLRLLHARRRPHRSADRDRAQAARHRAAHPHHHRGRRHRHHLGERTGARRRRLVVAGDARVHQAALELLNG